MVWLRALARVTSSGKVSLRTSIREPDNKNECSSHNEHHPPFNSIAVYT
jgi:hypothetical protein